MSTISVRHRHIGHCTTSFPLYSFDSGSTQIVAYFCTPAVFPGQKTSDIPREQIPSAAPTRRRDLNRVAKTMLDGRPRPRPRLPCTGYRKHPERLTNLNAPPRHALDLLFPTVIVPCGAKTTEQPCHSDMEWLPRGRRSARLIIALLAVITYPLLSPGAARVYSCLSPALPHRRADESLQHSPELCVSAPSTSLCPDNSVEYPRSVKASIMRTLS